MRLEIEKELQRKSSESGGGTYVALSDWAERFELSEPEVLREVADLVEHGPKFSITLEIFP